MLHILWNTEREYAYIVDGMIYTHNKRDDFHWKKRAFFLCEGTAYMEIPEDYWDWDIWTIDQERVRQGYIFEER